MRILREMGCPCINGPYALVFWNRMGDCFLLLLKGSVATCPENADRSKNGISKHCMTEPESKIDPFIPLMLELGTSLFIPSFDQHSCVLAYSYFGVLNEKHSFLLALSIPKSVVQIKSDCPDEVIQDVSYLIRIYDGTKRSRSGCLYQIAKWVCHLQEAGRRPDIKTNQSW